MMLNLAGGTVQCLNPECIARGRWLRLHDAPHESCNNCGAPLHSVPPPLPPRFRMRARPMRSYRPMGRGRWRFCGATPPCKGAQIEINLAEQQVAAN